jgi:hypothetical protein
MLVWQAYSPAMVFYFSIVVMVGAFFLINLTLAVINYYFNEAQSAMDAEDKAKAEANNLGDNKDEELENAMN